LTSFACHNGSVASAYLNNLDTEKVKLLELADEPTACESPQGFNHHASMKRVENLKPKLNVIVGKPFELNANAQDASFFSELAILEPPIYGATSNHYFWGIGFSSFGNFFTVWSKSISGKIGDVKIAEVIAEIEVAGFVYIDAETLEQKYTGKNQLLADLKNWWSRYFDYL